MRNHFPLPKVFATCSCLFFGVSVHAQEPQITSPYLYSDTTTISYAYGSAKQLKGKTHIVNCFVSAGRYKWKDAEKLALIRKENEGLDWIINQGYTWNIDGISFSISNIGLEKDIQIEKIERSEEPKKLNVNWVPLVLNAAGFKDLLLFYDATKEVAKADNVVVLIFAKEEGRSYAQPANSNVRTNLRFLEGAVIYDQYYNGDESTSATITHELLHLFSARDIYQTRAKDADAEAKMRSVFKQSIMLETHREIKPLVIEQLTAWCIGWTKKYWGWYRFF